LTREKLKIIHISPPLISLGYLRIYIGNERHQLRHNTKYLRCYRSCRHIKCLCVLLQHFGKWHSVQEGLQ